jgi:hypothetical protein
VVNTVAGTASVELVRGNMGDNDQARILVGATATNAGFLEIATADDGTEPIHVRQYSGVFTTLTRTATLLDASGNTSFPGSVTANSVTLTGNTGTVTSVATSGTVSGLTLTGGTITTTGTITLGGTLAVTAANFASQTANTFLAAPNGSAGVPTFRTIVATDVPTLNQNTTGNAATATTFSTGRTNYKDVTDAAVAGQLMWKNYGNNHTIFDASAGTSPSGTAVNNTNAAIAWSGSYPTLMGWNGSSTYGVRVDSARVADNGGVTSVTATTPIVASPTTGAVALSHATSGVAAGTYNNVTVNVTGHVTGGSNVAYLTAEADTLATVTNRGNTATASIGLPAGEANGYCFWGNGTSYKILMGVTAGLFQYGTVTDYSIKMQMDAGSTGRGFTWGRDGVKPIASLNSTSGNMQIAGTFSALSKSFLIDHPTKPGMKLRHGSLEGPELGVYVRGKLVDADVIELPDYWTGLVHADSITVNLTAAAAGQQLYVERVENNCVYIVNETGKPVNCFYTVYGERKDVNKLAVEIE